MVAYATAPPALRSPRQVRTCCSGCIVSTAVIRFQFRQQHQQFASAHNALPTSLVPLAGSGWLNAALGVRVGWVRIHGALNLLLELIALFLFSRKSLRRAPASRQETIEHRDENKTRLSTMCVQRSSPLTYRTRTQA